MAKVTTDNIHYKRIATALRTHSGTDSGIKPSEMADKIDTCVEKARANGYSQGVTEGKASEYNEFWDTFQNGGKRTGYLFGFSGKGWTADNFKPKYDIIAVGNTNHMFNSNSALVNFADYLEKHGLRFDISGVTSTSEMFRYSKFTRLPVLDFRNVTDLYYVFGNNTDLHTIDEIKINSSVTFNNTFRECTNLTEIRFDGVISKNIDLHWSKHLSFMSLASIIGALSDTVTGQTITLPETARETYNNATISGRWDELISEHPNWTFAYA